MITKQEADLIANITSDPAYILLLEKIKSLIDSLTDRLHTANKAETDEVIAYWRALRTIYIELRDTPQEMAKYVADLNLDPDKINMEQNQAAQAQLQKVFKQYESSQEEYMKNMTDVFPQGGRTPYQNKSFGNLL